MIIFNNTITILSKGGHDDVNFTSIISNHNCIHCPCLLTILFYIAIKGMGNSLPFMKRHMLFFGYVSFFVAKKGCSDHEKGVDVYAKQSTKNDFHQGISGQWVAQL